MTLYDFNSFSEDEKAMAVWDGSFLGNRQENALTVQLYSVSDFYVEIYYDALANKIVNFRSFKSLKLLVPYISHTKFDFLKP